MISNNRSPIQEKEGLFAGGPFQQLFSILWSDVYERGESIEEVLQMAMRYRTALDQDAGLRDSESHKLLYWHLDNLIHEAGNMKKNPNHDLFLYLKALHGLRDTMKKGHPFLNFALV
ncbi:hypothetical protein ACD591_04905 [Rufibacter glacialis]|uniref:Uncharacterized protein n=1 Tax=Rufibacter glacialis TaxID=1259555 RepID=A0A5M8QK61_9BACT|nr:hypothetical protein [Rufibacter glacialis]KAA6434692.1 hypothetical protein FOE74_10965 [Rufibacter glacialis]GGK71644.1 hypothetical protein GCM10011405_19810 [Rufibacter glacialis]